MHVHAALIIPNPLGLGLGIIQCILRYIIWACAVYVVHCNRFWPVVSTLITCAVLLIVLELVIRVPPKIQSLRFNIGNI